MDAYGDRQALQQSNGLYDLNQQHMTAVREEGLFNGNQGGHTQNIRLEFPPSIPRPEQLPWERLQVFETPSSDVTHHRGFTQLEYSNGNHEQSNQLNRAMLASRLNGDLHRGGPLTIGNEEYFIVPQQNGLPNSQTSSHMNQSKPNRLWELNNSTPSFDGEAGRGRNGLAAAAAAAVSAAKMAIVMNGTGYRGAGGIDRSRVPQSSGHLNTKGLPIRPGELECAFYMKSGSCKYGATCRYHHPELVTNGAHHPLPGNPITLPTFHQQEPTEVWLTGNGPKLYPERPGQPECAFYLKTGMCKFGALCKFHHPRVRAAFQVQGHSSSKVNNGPVKLTLAGFPRREGEVACAYYMKTGTCKYGATCKFDHPPPAEAAAMAAAMAAKKDSELYGIEHSVTGEDNNNNNDSTTNYSNYTKGGHS